MYHCIFHFNSKLVMYLCTIFLSTSLTMLGPELAAETALTSEWAASLAFSLPGPPYFFLSRQSLYCTVLYWTRTWGWRSVQRPPSHPAWSSSWPSPENNILYLKMKCCVWNHTLEFLEVVQSARRQWRQQWCTAEADVPAVLWTGCTCCGT